MDGQSIAWSLMCLHFFVFLVTSFRFALRFSLRQSDHTGDDNCFQPFLIGFFASLKLLLYARHVYQYCLITIITTIVITSRLLQIGQKRELEKSVLDIAYYNSFFSIVLPSLPIARYICTASCSSSYLLLLLLPLSTNGQYHSLYIPTTTKPTRTQLLLDRYSISTSCCFPPSGESFVLLPLLLLLLLLPVRVRESQSSPFLQLNHPLLWFD